MLLIPGRQAWALDGAAHAECVGSAHVVTVSGFYIEEVGGEPYDGEISGLVFECQAIGICEPGYFYPEVPLPFDPQPSSEGWPVYEAEVTIVPPFAGVAYRYVPHGVRPDGSLVRIDHYCDADLRSYALASCDEVPIARGILTLESVYGEDIYFRIDPCDANCWTEGIGTFLNIARVEELSGQPFGNLLGQEVDVFGTRTYCTMSGGDHHELTRIALSPAGDCGPVPVESKSWGDLKAMYR